MGGMEGDRTQGCFQEAQRVCYLDFSHCFPAYLATRAVHCILFLHDRAAYNNNNSQDLRNLCSLITGKKATSSAPVPIKVAGNSQHVSELCRLQLLMPDTCSCLVNTYFAGDTLVLAFCSYREAFQRL